MITRRKFGHIIAGTALTGATATSLLRPVWAQSGTSSLERIKASGKLRIAAVADGAPYYQKSLTGGPWRGFYIDICTALAQDLNCELDITETTWGNSVLDLQADKIDVFFGLNPTPQRQKVIDFSVPVFNNAFALVAKHSMTAQSWQDFNNDNTRISVDAGSSHDAVVTRHLPNAQISRLKSQSDATAALQAGRVDAQCLILIIALTLVAKNPAIGKLVIPTPIDFSTSNAGFRRETDPSWQQFVNDWITARRASGFVRDAIVKNMALVGVKESDFPAGLTL